MVIQYKCPGCGADLVFDSMSKKLHCAGCGSYYPIDSMPAPDVPPCESEDAPKVSPFRPEDIFTETSFGHDKQESAWQHRNFSNGKVSEYHCKNCGAVVITDKDTIATSCSFCGAAVVLSDRVEGQLEPSRIIPFKINRDQATKAFQKWCKKGLLTPAEFKHADRVKNITGIYVPFWLYDLNGIGDIDATCTRVRTYTRGDYIYTETQYYHVYRKVNLNYSSVPTDASEKMNDTLMDRLEPYQNHELVTFEMPYLAGYLAEKYNFSADQLFPRVRDKVGVFVDNYLRNTIQGYQSVITNRKDINIYKKNAYYTLLPVWMVCYDFRDSEHIFAMNGQTGKIVGKPPLSVPKMIGWFFGVTSLSFLLIKLLVVLNGGPWL